MKVLVVDDEMIVAKALSRAFGAKGHEVQVAHSGEEGLEIWMQFRPEIILLDVIMPGLTGPQVLEEIQDKIKNDSSLIILMSAHSGVKGKDSALKFGADDFIEKPFENVIELVNMIETSWKKKRNAS